MRAEYPSWATKGWILFNPSRRGPRRFLLGLFLAAVISITFFKTRIDEITEQWDPQFMDGEASSSLPYPAKIFDLDHDSISGQHPIADLIKEADYAQKQILKKHTRGVRNAAKAYRARRGRHPPPRFEQWVAFAERYGCVMVEEFFDRIYHDLEPFWAVPPVQIRADSVSAPIYVRIRDGEASRSEEAQPFVEHYFHLVQKIAEYLPDLDMPINQMDESRVIVPWGEMASYVHKAHSSRKLNLDQPPTLDNFTALSDSTVPQRSRFESSTYWDFAKRACDPMTKASTLEIDKDFSTPPVFPKSHPFGTYSGFVKNWTVSQDFCIHSHLRNMHGTFVEPISISTTTSLLPIFSGSKLLINNDILIPAAMYWDDEKRFAASQNLPPWHKKYNGVFWRGTASGGRNRLENWTRFHRHRFVSLLNATQMDMTLQSDNDDASLPHNFPVPDQKLYSLVSAKLNMVGDWIRSFSNIAFIWLECFPGTNDGSCSYTGEWFKKGNQVPLEHMFRYKYLPDIDGNSFSGRFRAFMLSNSLPIKATIYTEWHDSRLMPWKHFVPMDNTFVDTLSILEYLFQHDKQAEKIATEGKKWAEKVLRKEDMLVYTYRLLLEFARVSDPNREDMGYGQDLR